MSNQKPLTEWGRRLLDVIEETGHPGWTRLAHDLGISPSTMGYWINNDREPKCSLETEVRIANKLGVGVLRLMSPENADLLTIENLYGKEGVDINDIRRRIGPELEESGFFIAHKDDHSIFIEKLTLPKQVLDETGRLQHRIARFRKSLLATEIIDGDIKKELLNDVREIRHHLSDIRDLLMGEIDHNDNGETM